MKRLSVLVVAHDAAPMLGRLLGALARELMGVGAEVVVVDNASRDGTADLVRLRHPWVRLVRSGQRLGWAEGINFAASHARGRTLALLRQDVLVEHGALERGLRAVERDPLIGLATGEVLDAGGGCLAGGCVQPQAAQEFFALCGLAGWVPGEAPSGGWDAAMPAPSPAARPDCVARRGCGAFAFMPRDLFEALGGLDPRYFHDYETQDFCRRLRGLGLRVQRLDDVRARCQGLPRGADAAAAAPPPGARGALRQRREPHGGPAAGLGHRLQRLGHALRGRIAAWRGRAGQAHA